MGNFSFGEERVGPTYCLNCICVCMNESNFGKQTKTDLKLIQTGKPKLVMLPNFNWP
jgi:hypothetical protein